jgi:hypothetical protein
MSGCDLCGDFPAVLSPRCHANAPLRVKMVSETELVLYCYVPTCGREVARLHLASSHAHRLSAALNWKPPHE